MTSNLGSQHLSENAGDSYEDSRRLVVEAVEDYFPTEFINRLDDIIVFRALTPKEGQEIATLRLEVVRQLLPGRKLTLDVDETARQVLGKAVSGGSMGARPLNRMIQHDIVNEISTLLLRNRIKEGEIVKVRARDGRTYVEPNHTAGIADSQMPPDNMNLLPVSLPTTNPARPSPTPRPGTTASRSLAANVPDVLLTDEADGVWINALSVARSVLEAQQSDQESVRAQPNAGVRPETPVEVDPNDPAINLLGDTKDIKAHCSPATLKVLDGAIALLRSTGDLWIAPHHLIISVMEDPSVNEVLGDIGLRSATLQRITGDLRRQNVLVRTSKSRWSVLQNYASDLTEEAPKKRIGPVIGRDREIRQLATILSRRSKGNAVLLGDPGVGKTAIAEGLAIRIVNRDSVPPNLNAKIFSLDMGSLLASTTCHRKLELRVKAILQEIQENEAEGIPVIIFIDDLHLIMTGRKTSGAGGMDVANLMKPLLARGKVRCFGAITYADYQREMESDESLAQRFSPIMKTFQEYHNIKVMDAALVKASVLAHEYIRSVCLSDSAINLVDKACSMLRMSRELRPEAIEEYRSRLTALGNDIGSLERPADQANPDSVQLLRAARAEEAEMQSELDLARRELTMEKERRGVLQNQQKELVIGQPEAVHTLSRAIQPHRSGLADRSNPVASFLLVGRSGTGKSLLATKVVEFFFWSQEVLVKINGSEFADSTDLTRLVSWSYTRARSQLIHAKIGTPSCSGIDQGGVLTECVKRKPFSVILIDHIDKACQEFISKFRTIID
ncbi:hypothetical protein FRB97_001210 [Tulasnella sp. 331]|nr:hypothetical protein FRB97_001210 [Tulasnella sp. 331]